MLKIIFSQQYLEIWIKSDLLLSRIIVGSVIHYAVSTRDVTSKVGRDRNLNFLTWNVTWFSIWTHKNTVCWKVSRNLLMLLNYCNFLTGLYRTKCTFAHLLIAHFKTILPSTITYIKYLFNRERWHLHILFDALNTKLGIYFYRNKL